MDLQNAAKEKKILIFDFDGTIALLDIDWKYYFSQTRKYFNKKDQLLLEKASHFEDFLEVESLYFEKYGLEAREELKAITLPLELSMHGYTPNSQLIEFIKKEHASYVDFFIWSSNHYQTIVKILKELGLRSYFKQIVSKDSVVHLKPNAEGFKHIFDGYKYSIADYLFIGNSKYSDGGAAKSIELDFYHEKYFP